MSETLYMRRVRRGQIMYEAVTYYADDLDKMEGNYALVSLADDNKLLVHDGAGKFICHARPVMSMQGKVLS
ncbi:hypothetical protein [Methylomonas rapida]|uniref:Transposase n=1 Tax=Methylomonas rapida TaxID=2963939 RepID=A0ABY7GLW2_9GAMM|nr:hypothetical protein [Methylomonas rapida]WAR45487.1 hypothetical protein NM686_002945 [Methylomonas rapida]